MLEGGDAEVGETRSNQVSQNIAVQSLFEEVSKLKFSVF